MAVVPVLAHPPQPRADDAADERGEDDLVGPVDRLAELLQAPRDDQPETTKPRPSISPKVCSVEAEDVRSRAACPRYEAYRRVQR